MRVSFVVLSFNSARFLERCIRSLVAQASSGERDEIWVVENGSTDGSADLLRSLQATYPDVLRTIFLDENKGTTVSRNLALPRVTGRYVAIVDSDVDVPPGTVDSLIAHLDAHDGGGLIAPMLLYPSGRLQLSVDRFPTLPHKVKRYLALRQMERTLNDASPPAGLLEVDYAISAFWLMKAEVVKRVGLLDERIFYAPEDVDYCLRVWNQGYAVLYDATAHVLHDAQEISRVAPWRRIALSHLLGLIYLFRKHRYLLSLRGVYRSIQHTREYQRAARLAP